MSHYDELTLFALVAIAIWGVTIVVPYLKGHSHLFTLWNCFLIGSIEFVGIACLSLTRRWQEPWGAFARDETRWLMTGIFLFYLAAYGTYYGLPFHRVAGVKFRKWPIPSERLIWLVCLFSATLSTLFFSRLNIPIVSQIVRLVGNKAFPFGTVFLFVAWSRDRGNPMRLAALGGFVAYGLILGILAGGGRRTFISALAGLPIAYYWLQARRFDRQKTLVGFSVAAVLCLGIVVVYGGLRHRARNQNVKRDLKFAVETIAMIPERFFKGDGKQLLGQRAIECSMIARRTYGRHLKPFASLIYVVSNPVPRSMWPTKPVGLGYSLPKDYGANTRASWGPGIVGHAAHEGYLSMMFYGVLFAGLLRLSDEFMARQPNNPFFIATYVSIFPHVIGWVRGDIGTFTLQIIGGILTLFVFVSLVKIFWRGPLRSYSPTWQHYMSTIIRLDNSVQNRS